jgi:uncharacterized membrane protein HdeD (DUF308 family)
VGVLLVVSPEQSRVRIATFMSVYWIASGITSLAWARRGPFLNRAAAIAGIVGVATGLLVLTQIAWGWDLIDLDLAETLLGLTILLTGVLHLAGSFLVGETRDRWPVGHFLLGILEVALGFGFLFGPFVPGAGRYLLVTAWAFCAAIVLGMEVFRLRRRWHGEGD